MSTFFSDAYALILQKLAGWSDNLVLNLPNIVLAILVIFVSLRIIKVLRRVFSRMMIKSIQSESLRQLLNNVFSVVCYLLLFMLILVILGLQKPLTAVLASAGVAGLAVGLALQDPLTNIFSGAIMSVRDVFQIGDYVETNGYIGIVREITLKTTVVQTLSGEMVNIPNKMVLQNPIKNFTTNNSRRVQLDCGISYAENLEEVKRISLDAIRDLAIDTVERPVEFLYTGFGDSSITFMVRFWINPSTVYEFLEAKSNAVIRLKAAFDKHGITIPFPIRTLDFGIKGGKELGQVLSQNGKPFKIAE